MIIHYFIEGYNYITQELRYYFTKLLTCYLVKEYNYVTYRLRYYFVK